MKKLILTLILTLSTTFNVFGQTMYTTDNVNIRQEPNTDSYKLGTIEKGVEIEVLEQISDWYKVQLEGTIAYIKSEFLSETKVETTYQTIYDNMTDEEELLLAQLLYHEARGESFEGQCAVLEVVLNRVTLQFEGNTNIHDIIYAKKQFSTARKLNGTVPLQTQYDVINYVKENGATQLDTNYIYFSTKKCNGKGFIKIGRHWFSH